MKNLTYFRILMETGMDPRLALLVSYSRLDEVLHSSHALYMLHHRMMLIFVFRPSINTSVVVQFLFSFVLNSLSFISVPKNKGK